MNGFTSFKRGECPICNGARNDCRQSNESGMVFCRESSANPTGFIFRGLDKLGFGLWQSSEAAEAFAQQSKEEWQKQKEEWKKQQAQWKQKQIDSQLPALERDKYYQKLLAQLPLEEIEKCALTDRGFTPEQIKADGYRSVNQWQQILGVFPSNLPGRLSNGSLNSQSGCIFPIRDVDGLIVALSIRLRDGSNGRYRWLTSATKKNPDGATPHLNGELPLAVFEPSEYRGDAIWLTEGVGIKPSLVRYRSGVPVVGASSGLFSGSPNTCKITLEKLAAKYHTQKLVIAVDAGDIKNAHVSHRWQGEIDFLQSLGYEIKIAWWGQIEKTDSDIDELDDLSKIEFISCEDFLGVTKEEIDNNAGTKNQSKSKTTIFDILNPPLIESLPVHSFNDALFKVLPIPESIASVWQKEDQATRKKRRWFDSVLNRVKKVFSKSAKKQKQPRLGFDCFKEPNPEFEEKIRQAQRKLRSLSYEPDIEFSQRYLPDELVNQLPKSGLIGIKAPKGCGKSVLLKKIIAIAKKQGIPVLSITPRIALGREQAIKWEITWIDDYGVFQTEAGDTTAQIQEVANKRSTAEKKLAELESINYQQLNLLDETEVLKLEQQKEELRIEIERYEEEIENINLASIKTLALCWDSLWRTKDRDLKEGLIVIDEAELGFQHFVTGFTCRRNRPHLLKVFKEKLIECLMSGGRVILSDADLSDLPIDYVREILPVPIKPFIVVNKYAGEETKWVVDFRTGSRGDTLSDITEDAEDEKYLAITTDSQAEAQALEERILKEFPDDFCAFLDRDGNITQDAQTRKKALIVRIDRTTTESEAGKKFIQKPNEQILHWQPRILIYTPSMGVGVSIDESTQRWDEDWEEMVPYFDVVYGLFFGVIEPSQCRQQLSRVRANVPRIVYCKESSRALEGCSSFFPDEVNRQTLKYSHSSLNILDIAKGIAGDEADDEETREVMLQILNEAWDKDSRCWKEPSIDLAAKFKARENYSKWNLANLLREELEDEGHTVVSIKGTKTVLVEEMADIKDELKAEEALAFSVAPIMPLDEAKKVINTLGVTKEQKLSAQKSLLQDELPKVNLTPEFVKKAVIDDRRRWLNQQRLFWYLTNIEAVKQIDTDHWLSNLKKFAEGTPFMRDIRSYAPKVKAILESGVFEFIDLQDFTRTYQGDTPEAKAFLKKCLKKKDLIQTALNILVTKKTSPIWLVNRILGKVGLALEKLTKSKKDSRYCLSVDLITDPDRANVLKAFELRWQMSQEEAAQKMAEKQAQTQQQQAIQTGGLVADYIDIKVESPPHTPEESQGIGEFPSGQSVAIAEQVVTEQAVAEQAMTEVPQQISSGQVTESSHVDQLTALSRLAELFCRCETETDFTEISKFAPEGESASEKEEQVENAILFVDSLQIRSRLHQWWNSVLWKVRDFWRELECQEKSCVAVT